VEGVFLQGLREDRVLVRRSNSSRGKWGRNCSGALEGAEMKATWRGKKVGRASDKNAGSFRFITSLKCLEKLFEGHANRCSRKRGGNTRGKGYGRGQGENLT